MGDSTRSAGTATHQHARTPAGPPDRHTRTTTIPAVHPLYMPRRHRSLRPPHSRIRTTETRSPVLTASPIVDPFRYGLSAAASADGRHGRVGHEQPSIIRGVQGDHHSRRIARQGTLQRPASHHGMPPTGLIQLHWRSPPQTCIALASWRAIAGPSFTSRNPEPDVNRRTRARRRRFRQTTSPVSGSTSR